MRMHMLTKNKKNNLMPQKQNTLSCPNITHSKSGATINGGGVWESGATINGGGAGDFRDEFENECGEDVQRFGIRVLHFRLGIW